MAKSNKEPQRFGILGLPPNWSIAVQLIGTFGLAVFLVLWYVFVMHPAEIKRYDKLNTSIIKQTEKVDNLAETIKGNQLILKEYQSAQLEELFTNCVACKLTDLIIEYKKIQRDFPILELQKQLENILIIGTKLAAGLLYGDASNIERTLKDKILKYKIAESIAAFADREDYEFIMENRDVFNNQFRSEILIFIRQEDCY